MFSYVRGGNETDRRSGKKDVLEAKGEIARRFGSECEKFRDTQSCNKIYFSNNR